MEQIKPKGSNQIVWGLHYKHQHSLYILIKITLRLDKLDKIPQQSNITFQVEATSILPSSHLTHTLVSISTRM